MRQTLSLSPVILILLFLMAATSQWARADGDLEPFRDSEPVVLRGDHFPDWLRLSLHYPGSHLNLYRYEGGEAGGTFHAIPFQIDKRRKIDLRFNVPAEHSGPGNVTDLEKGARQCMRLCEWGYFPMKVLPAGISDPFSDDAFYPQDEIAFMLADAGSDRAPVNAWLAANVKADRYEIQLLDKLNGATRWVYAFMWTDTPTDLSTVSYVSYEPDDPEDVLNCPPSIEACGTATAQPSDRLSNYAGFVVHWGGNWILDALQYDDGSSGDLIDEWRLETGNEDEHSWSSAGRPQFLAWKVGPVRMVRGIQGAQSGVMTTRYDFVYPTRLETVTNLRVHDINLVRVAADHDPELQPSSPEAYVHVDSSLGDSALSDEVDGAQGTESPVEEAFGSWTETKTSDRGSLYTWLTELRKIKDAERKYHYLDTQDLLGSYRQKWTGLPWMQDGGYYRWKSEVCGEPPEVPAWDPPSACCELIDLSLPDYPPNDGGCPDLSDPEDSSYYWTQQKLVFFPHSTEPPPSDMTRNRVTSLTHNSREAISISTQHQINNENPAPPQPPCIPSLGAQSEPTGDLFVEVQPPCADVAGLHMDLYRAVGDGPLVHIAQLGGSRSYRDGNVTHGKAYRYAARSYAHGGSVSALSQEVTITSVDTTPPVTPAGLEATTNGLQATLTWKAYRDDDLKGFNGYVAASPGGPYQKINGSVRPIYQPWEMSLIVSAPGTYYVTMTSVDFAGNESSMSDELTIVLGP